MIAAGGDQVGSQSDRRLNWQFAQRESYGRKLVTA
jgi:hypothetical protein